jgi:carnitine O-acetyltransferase
MDYSPNNTAAVQALESAILLVSLDDYTPTTEDQRAWSYWSGGLDRSAQSGHGKNRWFDKHEIIVDESGESGFNGERKCLSFSSSLCLESESRLGLMIDSMLDGTPTLRMNEFMLAGIEKGQIPLELPESEKNNSPMPSPHEVVFEMDHKLKSAVAKSYQGFGEEMAQQDLKVSLPLDSISIKDERKSDS